MNQMTEMEQKAFEKVKECVSLLESKHSIHFPMPTVKFDIRPTAGLCGEANYSRWTIRLNPTYFTTQPDDFINSTIPHEVAHLAEKQIYGTSGHGKNWQKIMLKTFGLQPHRTLVDDYTKPVTRSKSYRQLQIEECKRLNKEIPQHLKRQRRPKKIAPVYLPEVPQPWKPLGESQPEFQIMKFPASKMCLLNFAGAIQFQVDMPCSWRKFWLGSGKIGMTRANYLARLAATKGRDACIKYANKIAIKRGRRGHSSNQGYDTDI